MLGLSSSRKALRNCSGCSLYVFYYINLGLSNAKVSRGIVIRYVIDILIHDLKTKFKIDHPKILVCGLNPHAGEGGYLGMEEIEVINPVLESYREQSMNMSLSMPADTLFTPENLKDADAVLAMYHDQGLPVLKAQGFGEAINITLGLPFIRTSVDHGTALSLAGTGLAKSSSLQVAVDLALELARHH